MNYCAGCWSGFSREIHLTFRSPRCLLARSMRACRLRIRASPYTHPSLGSLLTHNHVSWAYYGDAAHNIAPGTDLWTAPNAFSDICLPVVMGLCTGTEFMNHVVLPGDSSRGNYTEPILWDLGDNTQGVCGLKSVSWVIPDGRWSDHPKKVGHNGGPSWVAALVDALDGKNNDGTLFGQTENPCGYWDNTVILVVWDDWGGFYDDVDPNPTGQNGGYSNRTGGQYVYGFRVPLLVISKYAKPGYVSGPASGATCVGTYYCHDFGSILNFVEHTFGLPPINGDATSQDPYADALVRDITLTNTYSLADFFGTTPNPFTPIIITPQQYLFYPTNCFTTVTTCFTDSSSQDPDADAEDND
jgi:hypothetical protein